MKELKIEFTQEQIDNMNPSLTEKKVYDVYWVDTQNDLFLIIDDDRDPFWVPINNCKQAF